MFTEDLSPFFNTAGFAIGATLNGVAVQGIFDAGFDDATLAGFGTAGTSPTFMLASASVPAAPEGKAFTVSTGLAAGNYRVGNAKHDGTGVCTLELISRT